MWATYHGGWNGAISRQPAAAAADTLSETNKFWS